MRFAYYKSERDVIPMVLDAPWEELAKFLSEAEETPCTHATREDAKTCDFKKGPAWSPVDISGPRADKNVRHVTALVLDVDGVKPDVYDGVISRLAGKRHVVHSTHSDVGDRRSVRVILELSRPVLPRDWPTVWRAGMALLGIPGDTACGNVSRLYYLPRKPRGATFTFASAGGEPLDVDELLAPVAVPEVSPPLQATPVDLAEMRQLLNHAAFRKLRKAKTDPARYGREKAHAELLHRILDGQPFAVHGDFEGTTDLPRGRDQALNTAMSLFASVLPLGTSFDAVLAVITKSLIAIAPPETYEHWTKEARDMYERAAARRQEYEDETKEGQDRSRASFEEFMHRLRNPPAEPPPEAAEPDEDEEPAWLSVLQRDKNGDIRSTGLNLCTIFAHAAEIGRLRFNVVTKRVEVVGGLFEGCHLDVLPTAVGNWLTSRWNLQAPHQTIQHQLAFVARTNLYDPVKDYLESLRWDGMPRLEGWLTTYASASTTNEREDDVSEWVKQISRKWMIGLVARALRPGCQMDNVLVLEGPQGVGKTSLLRVLGSPWHSDTKIIIGDKDSRMVAARAWIVELGELASLKRAESETMKNFFSQRQDEFRPPYGVAVEEFPRRCVFVGTTNESGGYLVDFTGNRRYWPVHCGEKFDLVGLARDRDQLLAEAVWRLNQGESWWFDRPEAQKFEEAVTESRVQTPEGYEDEIFAWWKRIQQKPEFVTAHTIVSDALRLDPEKDGHGLRTKIGVAMKRLGWKTHRIRQGGRDGRLTTVFYPPKG